MDRETSCAPTRAGRRNGKGQGLGSLETEEWPSNEEWNGDEGDEYGTEGAYTMKGGWIADVLEGLSKTGPDDNGGIEVEVREQTLELCRRYPIYPGLME